MSQIQFNRLRNTITLLSILGSLSLVALLELFR
jgi:hypothetical protein